MAEAEKLTVQVNDAGSVTAMLYLAAKKNRAGVTMILGHGAGADQMSGFMRMAAAGLAARGLDALTFNFLYKEQKRGAPDPKAKLESCYRSVIEAARQQKKLKDNRLLIGGKSMGGRIASQVAAEDSEGIAGLVYLGYPLHPPGRLDKMRDEHLPRIKAPMLFVQGSRDAFGGEEEIRAIIKKHRLDATLYAIAGGDHSFKVPKSVGTPQMDVYQAFMDEVARWTKSLPNSH
jgi:predicted alpha/beta-hydrolase family hydrolase